MQFSTFCDYNQKYIDVNIKGNECQKGRNVFAWEWDKYTAEKLNENKNDNYYK